MQTHRINEQLIELRTPDEALARGLLPRVSALHRRELVAILDRVCSELSPADRLHRVETLELDLGTIDIDEFERGFCRAFEAALRRGLGDAIRELDDRVTLGAEPRSRSRIELLEVFARTGILPWWADNSDRYLIATQLMELRGTPGALSALRALVIRLAARPPTLARLVHAAGEGATATLVDAFAPGTAWAATRLLASELARSCGVSERLELWRIALVGAVGPRRDSTVSDANGVFVTQVAQTPVALRRGWNPAVLAEAMGIARPNRRDDQSGVPERIASPGSAESPGSREYDGTRAPDPGGNQVPERGDNPLPSSSTAEPGSPEHDGSRVPERGDTPLPSPDLNAPAALLMPESIPVDNAGLVLLWPFLPRLFERCELTVEGEFRSDLARARAVALLGHLVYADSGLPEFMIPLDKVLCGLTPSAYLEPIDPLAPELLTEGERMLEAVVAHAEILRDMDIDTLRATFLRREGVLGVRDGEWLLRVERQTHDLVLDRFPWSWTWVSLPWMPEPLRVEW